MPGDSLPNHGQASSEPLSELVGVQYVLFVDVAAMTQWTGGYAFLSPNQPLPLFPGLLSEITDPESFLKDLLNSVP